VQGKLLYLLSRVEKTNDQFVHGGIYISSLRDFSEIVYGCATNILSRSDRTRAEAGASSI